jgi:peptidoglycan-associated lipoprotein
MKMWKTSLILSIFAIAALTLAGCCGPEPAPYDSSLATVEVEPEPVVVEAEPVVVVEEEPSPTLAESAAAAGALKKTYFAFDKANLTPTAVEKLDKTAAWMQQNPSAKIEIAGHCDERGTNEYNMALGERRANSAKKYLVSMGISSDRLMTISYGEERPVDPGHDEAAWARNRRNEYAIVQ